VPLHSLLHDSFVDHDGARLFQALLTHLAGISGLYRPPKGHWADNGLSIHVGYQADRRWLHSIPKSQLLPVAQGAE
jgi:hypothetical protein